MKDLVNGRFFGIPVISQDDLLLLAGRYPRPSLTSYAPSGSFNFAGQRLDLLELPEIWVLSCPPVPIGYDGFI